jgi:hypothetical protein
MIASSANKRSVTVDEYKDSKPSNIFEEQELYGLYNRYYLLNQ